MPFVKLPVSTKSGSSRIYVIHIIENLLLGSHHVPNTYFTDFTIKLAGEIGRFAIGMADFEHEILTTVLHTQINRFSFTIILNTALFTTVYVDNRHFLFCIKRHRYMIPFAFLQKLAVISVRKFNLIARELQLLRRKTCITQAEQAILLDTHNRRYFSCSYTILKVIHTYNGLVGKLLHVVYHISRGTSFIKARHFKEIIFQTDSRSDGTGTTYHITNSL